jgi:Protein of unknown function (DUF3160)
MLRRFCRLTFPALLATSTVLACSAANPSTLHVESPVASAGHDSLVIESKSSAPAAPVYSSSDLGYNPSEAQHFDQLTYTPWLHFDKPAQGRLVARGIVALPIFSGYATGLSDIYRSDLPVWITADAILHALHWSHAETIGLFERQVLVPELTKILDAARKSIGLLKTDNKTRAEIDVYLTVAASLIHGRNLPCVAGGDTAAAWRTISGILRAEGTSGFELFGRTMIQPLEVYEVRGHYLKEVELQRFFRARKWLSRTALPLVEVRDGITRVNHDLVAIARLLSQLVLRGSGRAYDRMSRAESELVGPPALLGPLDMSTVAVAENATGATDESDVLALLDALDRATGARPPRPETDPAQAVMPGYSAVPIAEFGQEHRSTTTWLHATVGPPHPVIVAVEGRQRPRVFVGMVASYQSFLSERVLDEQRWYEQGWAQAKVPDWYAPLYTGPPVP